MLTNSDRLSASDVFEIAFIITFYVLRKLLFIVSKAKKGLILYAAYQSSNGKTVK